ncbi:hypothetical protein BDY19DRAFT_994091 [Irpex rosettiformis]|uniref:Uncharacterized protein n=1 Tax=Irpex rosettiformis TaxID=378272 RepID=A0ACB8U346_9APHY|nr:hypothetical protein BDY19DRAFT_994091 [Irpex rosettiformis]
MPNNEHAEVFSSGPNKIPLLSSGELTIEVFLQWKNMCEDFFEIKEIDDKENSKCIILAMTGIQDLLVRNWYQAEHDRFKKLTWSTFTVEFYDRWLSTHWEQKSQNLVTCARQSNTDTFKDWIVQVETLNANLISTASHKNEQ